MIGNDFEDGFAGKMNETVKVVKTLMGFPTNRSRFRKFLVDNGGIDHCGSDLDCPIKPKYEDFHAKLFALTNLQPYNNELDQKLA